ncbi:MAG: PAS domain S-box protein [Gaiellaceae bacterium]
MSIRRPRLRQEPPHGSDGLASALLESLSDPVLACDAEGTMVLANQSARTILGSSGDPVPAEEWTVRCPIYRPDGTQVTRREDLPLAHALEGEDVRDVRLEVRPNGRRRIMSVSGGPVRGPRGEIRGAVIVMREITARVALDDRLRLESAVAANVADGIALIRASDGEIMYANESWEGMFGYEPGELVGERVSRVNAPTEEAPEELARKIARALERDGVWTGEVHNVRKDGTRFWTSASVSPFEDPEQGAVWAVIQTDMTKRRVAEETLRAAEERFHQIFDEGPVGTLVLENDMRIADANQAFCDITGYHRDELVGRQLSDIARPHDLGVEGELESRLDSGAIPRYRLEKRLATKNAEAVLVDQTTTVVRGSDEEALCRVATFEAL